MITSNQCFKWWYVATAPHFSLVTGIMNRLRSLLLLVLLSILVIAATADFPHTKPKNHPVSICFPVQDLETFQPNIETKSISTRSDQLERCFYSLHQSELTGRTVVPKLYWKVLFITQIQYMIIYHFRNTSSSSPTLTRSSTFLKEGRGDPGDRRGWWIQTPMVIYLCLLTVYCIISSQGFGGRDGQMPDNFDYDGMEFWDLFKLTPLTLLTEKTHL